MISATIFSLYMVLILVIPICEYYPPRCYRILMSNMSYTVNGHRFLAYLLALLVIFFHLSYFSAFPKAKGIMISTLFVFFLLSTRRTIKLLRLTNHSRTITLCIAIESVVLAFFPTFFSTAASMAFLLQIACVLPPAKDDHTHNDSDQVACTKMLSEENAASDNPSLADLSNDVSLQNENNKS